MSDPLETLAGMLALQEPFSRSTEQLHRTGELYTSVFEPPGELPADFGHIVRERMDRYGAIGLRGTAT